MDAAKQYEPITKGKALDIAVWLGNYMTKMGRINVLTADTNDHCLIILNVHIGLNTMSELLYPRGFERMRRNNLLLQMMDIVATPLLGLLRPLIVRWQIAVYATAYVKMLDEYPLYQHNIMMYCQYPKAVENAIKIT